MEKGWAKKLTITMLVNLVEELAIESKFPSRDGIRITLEGYDFGSDYENLGYLGSDDMPKYATMIIFFADDGAEITRVRTESNGGISIKIHDTFSAAGGESVVLNKLSTLQKSLLVQRFYKLWPALEDIAREKKKIAKKIIKDEKRVQYEHERKVNITLRWPN